jgi:hypothetical protein
VIKGNLEPKANPKHRNPLTQPLAEGVREARAIKGSHGAARLPHPGKDDAVCPAQARRIRANIGRKPYFRAGALHAPQVSGVVVDDDRFRHRQAPQM